MPKHVSFLQLWTQDAPMLVSVSNVWSSRWGSRSYIVQISCLYAEVICARNYTLLTQHFFVSRIAGHDFTLAKPHARGDNVSLGTLLQPHNNYAVIQIFMYSSSGAAPLFSYFAKVLQEEVRTLPPVRN